MKIHYDKIKECNVSRRVAPYVRMIFGLPRGIKYDFLLSLRF